MRLDDAMKGYGAMLDADRPATIADMINILGGTGHVAELMGVTPRTVQRWRASETKSASQQRPGGAARVRPELEKLATDKQMDELRQRIVDNGLGVHFDGEVKISEWEGPRDIDTRLDADSVEDFDERVEAWLGNLQNHKWAAAARQFNAMFWESYLPFGRFENEREPLATIEDMPPDGLYLDAFNEPDES